MPHPDPSFSAPTSGKSIRSSSGFERRISILRGSAAAVVPMVPERRVARRPENFRRRDRSCYSTSIMPKKYPRPPAATNSLPDTSPAPRSYCPGCEPDADPGREILDLHWCASHAPAYNGVDDPTVTGLEILSGSTEAGGDENRLWCQMIHHWAGSRAKAATRGSGQPASSGNPRPGAKARRTKRPPKRSRTVP